MKHAYDYYVIDRLKKRKLVQIGACDGVMADNVRRYILSYRIDSLLIEPISYNYDLLVANYKNYDFVRHVNVAIDDKLGYRDMSYFQKVPGKDHMIGVASFYDTTWKKEMPNHVMHETVECDTLNNVLQKFDMFDANIYQIDTEGHDYHIVKQVDFASHMGKEFFMVSEHFWDTLTSEFDHEKHELVRSLKEMGYDTQTVYGKRSQKPSGLQVFGSASS